MSNEAAENIFNVSFGLAPRYSDEGVFVQKFFLHMDRLFQDEFLQRVKARTVKGEKDG